MYIYIQHPSVAIGQYMDLHFIAFYLSSRALIQHSRIHGFALLFDSRWSRISRVGSFVTGVRHKFD